jgi:hypothetical protein
MKRPGWVRISAPGAGARAGHWRYEPNGCEVRHSGDRTAIWPYSIVTPENLSAPDGRCFMTLKIAMAAAEGLELSIHDQR